MGALEQIKKWRRQLHQIPEIGLQEYQTSNYLKKELIEMVSKMTTKRPIIANSSDILSLDNDARNVIELESQSTDVYSLFLPIPQPCGRDWTAGICKIRDNMQLPFQHDSVSFAGPPQE